MTKVSIKPEAVSVEQATRLFDALDSTGRQEFYKSLSDDEKDALYDETTNNLIASIHLTTKNRVDAKTNTERNTRRGYIVPDECHRAENDCLWRSGAWYFIMGHVSKSLLNNLAHMRQHFDALQETQENETTMENEAGL